MNGALLLAVPLLPLVLAVFVGLRPGRARLNRMVPWTALPGLLLAALAPTGLEATFDSLLMGTHLALDPTGRAFLALTAGLWLAAGLFALSERRDDPRRHRFYVFWLLALAGNLGLILAQDALAFYLFFALMSLSAYGLVVHSGKPEAWRAGRVYLILAVLGEVLLFAGLVLAVHSAGQSGLAAVAAARPDGWALVLLVLGLGIKAGMLPLHFWLPLAHPAAPVPASAVLSGAMIKAGLLGWMRLLPIDAAGHAVLGEMLMLLGLAAAFLGVLIGVVQVRPKTILAYSSISQMGLMTAGIGLALLLPEARGGLLAAVTLYAVHHGLAKGALFLTAGMAGQWPASIPGRALFGLFTLLPALALAGLPFTSGALAKNVLKGPLAAEALPGWLSHTELLLSLAAAGTTALLLRFLWRWRTGLSTPADGAPDRRRWWAWGSLAAMAVLLPLGVWLAGPDGLPVTAGDLYGLALLWPVLLGLVLAGITWRWIHDRETPRVPEGDLAVLAEAAWRRACRAERRLRLPPPQPRRMPARLRVLRLQLRQRLEDAERVLTRWETIGLLFSAAMLGLYLTLLAR
ncbi:MULTISPECIES: complex I subunit 5 family protein [unclassified Thioalkalivibrio]|uniref:complex I subunit 5 family protein n=1 Tax=unclassified Thioalkalivibrio TaxID=2621013 RepID=UPI00037AAF4E|nr:MULTISPECIES: complex I subunit 5 family protein [unclassified Thioalkalivibrio]